MHDIGYADILNKHNRNQYAAVCSIIHESRIKYAEANYRIRPSEAISWAVNKVVPESVQTGRVYENILSEIDSLLFEYANDIEYTPVRESVINSINLSYSNNHLVYTYDDSLNEYEMSRVRIICKMLWDKLLNDRRY